MGGFGFKSRHKQQAPEPLRVDSTNKRKSAPEPSTLDELTLATSAKKSKRPKVPRSGGKSVASKLKLKELRHQELVESKEALKAKKQSKSAKKDQEFGSGSDDGSTDDEEDEGLEEARQAFFSAQDLVEPQDDNVVLDDLEEDGSNSEGDDLKSSDTATGIATVPMLTKQSDELLSNSSSPESDEGGEEIHANDGLQSSSEGFEDEGEEEFDDEGEEGSEDEREDILESDVMNHAKGIPDLRKLYSRIQESVRVLANWSVLGKRAKGKSRADLAEQTLNDICEYFGYNEFLSTLFWQLFGPEEALAFFEANETARPVTIRTNTLRTNRRDLAQTLINRGVNLEPIGKWSKVGLQVFESSVPVGATPEYLAGHYMLQAASSFLPVIALDPRPGQKCLDMSAAPGGKTTFMSAMMKNTGTLFANDSSKARCKSLMANVTRMGCHNVIISNHDARDFPKVMGGFDRVLLDAPCSGTGVISKDPGVKNNKSEKDLLLLSHLQKQLILCAIDSVSPHSAHGGYLVYSTCSVTIEENESVVDYALKKRPNVKLVETGIGFGKEGFVKFRGKAFNPTLKLTRRFYPHVHNVDGFFVAKLKVNPKPKPTAANGSKEVDDKDDLANEAEEPVLDETEGVAFDDSEDTELIAAARRAQLKAKGIHVMRPKDATNRPKKQKQVDQEQDLDLTQNIKSDQDSEKISTTLSRHPKKPKKKPSA